MALRFIDTVKPFGPFGNPGHVAKIYRDTEAQEYRVKLFIDGKHQTEADYHTDDKTDAENTAISMIGA